MKKILIGLIILFALAVITNPSERKHKDAVKREVNAMLEAQLGKKGDFFSWEPKLKGKAINFFIERENCYVYSKTKFKVLEEEKVIGYGFFGFVILNRSALQN
jgi:hypothetical protein